MIFLLIQLIQLQKDQEQLKLVKLLQIGMIIKIKLLQIMEFILIQKESSELTDKIDSKKKKNILLHFNLILMK